MSDDDQERVFVKQLQEEIIVLKGRINAMGAIMQGILDLIPEEEIQKEKDLICNAMIWIKRSCK